jgi:hypothetical protein
MGFHNQRKQFEFHNRSSFDYSSYVSHLSWSDSSFKKSAYIKEINRLKEDSAAKSKLSFSSQRQPSDE